MQRIFYFLVSHLPVRQHWYDCLHATGNSPFTFFLLPWWKSSKTLHYPLEKDLQLMCGWYPYKLPENCHEGWSLTSYRKIFATLNIIFCWSSQLSVCSIASAFTALLLASERCNMYGSFTVRDDVNSCSGISSRKYFLIDFREQSPGILLSFNVSVYKDSACRTDKLFCLCKLSSQSWLLNTCWIIITVAFW